MDSIRASSKKQNEDRQVIALKEMGITEKIYMDKQSGKGFNRPLLLYGADPYLRRIIDWGAVHSYPSPPLHKL